MAETQVLNKPVKYIVFSGNKKKAIRKKKADDGIEQGK